MFRTNLYFNDLTFNIFIAVEFSNFTIYLFYAVYFCQYYLQVLFIHVHRLPSYILDSVLLILQFSLFCYLVCFSRKFVNVRLSMILLIIQLYINIYSVYVYIYMQICLPASSMRDFAHNFTKIYSPIFFPRKIQKYRLNKDLPVVKPSLLHGYAHTGFFFPFVILQQKERKTYRKLLKIKSSILSVLRILIISSISALLKRKS